MKNTLLLISVVFLFITGCKKSSPTNSISSDKDIYSFVLPFPSPTPWQAGVIGTDTITVKVPPGVSLAGITPSIDYNGVSISPAIGTAQNFTSPVIYTVTAQDGSTRRYVVIASYKSTTKQITDFRFRPAENAGLAADAVGQLIDDSTITVRVPTTINVNSLVPKITHNGISITPRSGLGNDFSDVVSYTVTAEDGSTKKYNVAVNSNSMVYTGSSNGYLYALDANTGQLKWSFNGGGSQVDGPICYQGKVYVRIYGGPVYCLDAVTGSVLWSFPPAAANAYYGSLCVNNGGVYFGYSSTVSNAVGLIALNANTGSLLWNKIMNGFAYATVFTPTAAGNYVAVTELVSGLHVYNTATGNEVWGAGLDIIRTNPLIKAGVIYVGNETSFMRAFDLATGTPLWQNTTLTPNTNGSPVMVNDKIYVEQSNNIYALNKNTGAFIWSQSSLSSYTYMSSVTTSVNDNALYTGNNDGRVYSIDLTTGGLKWFYTINPYGGSYSPSPVAANGIVVVDGLDNSLHAISSKTGKLIWKFTAPGPLNTDPCITDVNGNGYYAGRSGND